MPCLQLCCACSCAVPVAVPCLQLSHALLAAEGRAAVTAMQSTPNYLWSTDDLLGQGATACVYKARSKVRGWKGWGYGHSRASNPPTPSCSGSARAALALFLFFPLWDTSWFWGELSSVLCYAALLPQHGEGWGVWGMPKVLKTPNYGHLHASCKHLPALG